MLNWAASRENLYLGFPTRSDSNWAAQPKRMAIRGYKFRIKEIEELYYLCSENKDADLPCCYSADDLHLCFAYAQKIMQVSHDWLKYNTGKKLP